MAAGKTAIKRFTERDEYGNANIIGVDMTKFLNLNFDELNTMTDALNKLAKYEDMEENEREILQALKYADAPTLRSGA